MSWVRAVGTQDRFNSTDARFCVPRCISLYAKTANLGSLSQRNLTIAYTTTLIPRIQNLEIPITINGQKSLPRENWDLPHYKCLQQQTFL